MTPNDPDPSDRSAAERFDGARVDGERFDGEAFPAFRLSDSLTLGFGSPESSPGAPEGTGAQGQESEGAAVMDTPVSEEASDAATPALGAASPTASVSAGRPTVPSWGTATPSRPATRIADLASENEIAAARRARVTRMARQARGGEAKEREEAVRSWRARGEAARKAGPPSFAQRRADWWRSVRYFFEDDEK